MTVLQYLKRHDYTFKCDDSDEPIAWADVEVVFEDSEDNTGYSSMTFDIEAPTTPEGYLRLIEAFDDFCYDSLIAPDTVMEVNILKCADTREGLLDIVLR